MRAVCGANCDECDLLKNNKCKGCKETNGCPFGKKCWIAKYIEVGEMEKFNQFKKQLIDELNLLNIDGMPRIESLYPLHGEYVNLEYHLPNGKSVCFLNNDEAYLGTQVENIYNDNESKRCFGLVANMNFLLVCEYDENLNHKEIIIYKKR